MNMNFTFAGRPHTYFGNGAFSMIPGLVRRYRGCILILTGKASFRKSHQWKTMVHELKKDLIEYECETVVQEPTPELIDGIVHSCRGRNVGLIVSIGGGSVIDAGKAVSAMIRRKDSILNYLEDIGDKKSDGTKVPFIAVPTTSGTGSEATKNAVISRIGKNGFKKSLRHENYIPEIAVIDPELTRNTPPRITAACGMDALTQLLESYVSVKSSPITDALALSGLEHVFRALPGAFANGKKDADARSSMSYGSYLSGITLANAGLGVVHGFASSIGGMFKIGHGVLCGTLLAASTGATVEKLIGEDPEGIAVRKYADAGRLATGRKFTNHREAARGLVEHLRELTLTVKLPSLSALGVAEKDIEAVAAVTDSKNNPVRLDEKELAGIIRERL